MRLDRLDLIRYGRFTDTSLVFAPADCDLQIVFGPNEAGKSTALAAIEDLLFGIPRSTPYSFLHANSALRLGGVLSQGDRRLEFRRRKGNRDTLLEPDESALPGNDAALLPFLNGVTRQSLTGMFGLNHERLAAGGKEMLEAKGEAGQALFSAGTGLTSLRQHIRQLERDADALWAPRRAGARAWYIAQDALTVAERRERECTVSAGKLQQVIHARDVAQATFSKLELDRQQKTQEQRKLNRIRRVHRNVQRLEEVEAELASFGVPAAFPADAETRLAAALRDRDKAQSRLDALREQLTSANTGRAHLVCDEDLLARADDVAGLRQQRIEVQKEQNDLPQRRLDLRNAKQQLVREATGLGWETIDPQAVAERIPSRGQVAMSRELATHRGALEGAVANASSAFNEAVERLSDLRGSLHALPAASDVAALVAALNTTQPTRDIAIRIADAESDRVEAQALIDSGLAQLKPAAASPELLETLPVPALDTVRSQRDQVRDQKQQLREYDSRTAAKGRELDGLRATLMQRASEERIATRETLDHARATRDTGWRLVLAHYVEHSEVLASEIEDFCGGTDNLTGAFEQKIKAADTLADKRFDKAQAAGELAAIDRQVKTAEVELESLRGTSVYIGETDTELQRIWCELWAPCMFEPLDPDVMIEWMQSREAILAALDKRRDAERRLATMRNEEAEARDTLSRELERVSPHAIECSNKPLRFLIECASGICQEHTRRAADGKAIETQIRKAVAEETSKRNLLQKAEDAWKKWQAKWNDALVTLGLPADTATEIALDQFDVIDTLRGLASNIEQLQNERIDKMERDITAFDRAVDTFVKAVATDLSGVEPGDAVVKLERRLAEAQQVKTQQQAADRTIAGLAEQASEMEENCAEADQIIGELQQVAGSQNLDQLREALGNARSVRDLSAEKAKLTADIVRDGDGHTLAELRAECAGISLNAVEIREDQLTSEMQELERQLEPATAARLDADRGLSAIGDGNDAAQAATEREEALTEMRNASERYVRARTAVVMLQQVIDRYQRERQDPLVKRAATLFAALTSGSFTGVRAEFDDEDHARLVGVRRDDSTVDVAGMSDGTADQLYLALRLAAIHEYLEQSPPMPVIADDLLVNFDDTRSAAALRVLGELARRTQVIFFTHHRHLVELAKIALMHDAHVVKWAGVA